INGEPISVATDSIFTNFYRQFYEEEKQNSGEEGIADEKNRELMRRALDATIQRTLILQFAKAEGIAIDRETVLATIIRKGYYAGNGKNFDEDRFDRTPESTKRDIFKSEEEQLIINLFYDQYFGSTKTSDIEVKAFFQFTDYGKKIKYIYLRYDDIHEEKLKTFYNENPRLFEKIHAAHILIKDDEQKANEILNEVLADPDKFEEIAKRESEDTTKDKGGDLGRFYRKDMVPEFSEAAFNLKKGEISPLVATMFGFHIIKALESPVVEPYDEALFRVKREYTSEYREEVEKTVASKTREILTRASSNPEDFDDAVSKFDLIITTTDYITVSGQYILSEEQDVPLFELMNNDNLIELVYSTEIGRIGGPVKMQDGEIIFRVLEEKAFDQEEYEKSKDYITNIYRNLKENNLFNDWYLHSLRNANIIDNFDQFFNS
ncbi:MAG: peptidylprolyl isomerase, partial [Spirochaetes bacterium]|nr:peptidylprolyl isomerase [Spirochaetota bacterium]